MSDYQNSFDTTDQSITHSAPPSFIPATSQIQHIPVKNPLTKESLASSRAETPATDLKEESKDAALSGSIDQSQVHYAPLEDVEEDQYDEESSHSDTELFEEETDDQEAQNENAQISSPEGILASTPRQTPNDTLKAIQEENKEPTRTEVKKAIPTKQEVLNTIQHNLEQAFSNSSPNQEKRAQLLKDSLAHVQEAFGFKTAKAAWNKITGENVQFPDYKWVLKNIRGLELLHKTKFAGEPNGKFFLSVEIACTASIPEEKKKELLEKSIENRFTREKLRERIKALRPVAPEKGLLEMIQFSLQNVQSLNDKLNTVEGYEITDPVPIVAELDILLSALSEFSDRTKSMKQKILSHDRQ